MDADDYQRLASRTLISEPDSKFTSNELAVMLAALELAARAGAVCDYLKKAICHRHGFDRRKLRELLNEVIDMADVDVMAAYNVPLSASVAPDQQMLIWNALGVAGEAGEVAELTRQIEYGPVNANKIAEELGDLEWYIAALCTKLDVRMSTVMEHNIEKLRRRYPEGYTSADSIARQDVHSNGQEATPQCPSDALCGPESDGTTGAR